MKIPLVHNCCLTEWIQLKYSSQRSQQKQIRKRLITRGGYEEEDNAQSELCHMPSRLVIRRKKHTKEEGKKTKVDMRPNRTNY